MATASFATITTAAVSSFAIIRLEIGFEITGHGTNCWTRTRVVYYKINDKDGERRQILDSSTESSIEGGDYLMQITDDGVTRVTRGENIFNNKIYISDLASMSDA